MIGRWRRVLFALGLALGLALLLWQVWRGYVAIQHYGFRVLCPACLVASLALSLLLQLVQMLAWIQVMRYLGYPLPFGRALAGYMLSFLPRYIPGSVWGYLGRSEWLARSYGISYAGSMTGSLLEALALVVTGLCYVGFYYSTRLDRRLGAVKRRRTGWHVWVRGVVAAAMAFAAPARTDHS